MNFLIVLLSFINSNFKYFPYLNVAINGVKDFFWVQEHTDTIFTPLKELHVVGDFHNYIINGYMFLIVFC